MSSPSHKPQRKKHLPSVWIFLFLLSLSLQLISNPLTLATTNVYFTSVNDKVLPLSDSTMPIWVNGQIYVPYTTFDQHSTGTDHGISAQLNASATYVTLEGKKGILTFDIKNGQCYDEVTKFNYPYQAILQNGIPFLPVVGVCSFFDMTYTYQKIDYGYLLRIKGENTVLTDSRFIDAAKSLFQSLLDDYLAPPETPSPLPEEHPLPEQEPEDEEPEEEVIPETPLLLAVDMIDYNVNLPDTLANRGIYAIFFFHLEQIESQGSLIRRLLGQGHSIGLQTRGESLDAITEELAQCNTLFYQQARTTSQIVHVPIDYHQEVEAMGYIPWQGGEAKSIASFTSLLGTIPQGDKLQYLTLEQTEETAQYFLSFYRLLQEKGFILQIPREDIL